MRLHFTIALSLLLTGSVAYAGEPARRGTPPFSSDAVADPATAARAAAQGYILPRSIIQEVVTPSDGDIRDCWLTHATRRGRRRGDLRIDVVIAPTGIVLTHDLLMAGRPPRLLRRCIGKVVAAWRFPMRRAFTLASLPYHFIARGGAGPFRSCWNPRGCPRRATEPRHEPPRP